MNSRFLQRFSDILNAGRPKNRLNLPHRDASSFRVTTLANPSASRSVGMLSGGSPREHDIERNNRDRREHKNEIAKHTPHNRLTSLVVP
jgi:hypothetical protein